MRKEEIEAMEEFLINVAVDTFTDAEIVKHIRHVAENYTPERRDARRAAYEQAHNNREG